MDLILDKNRPSKGTFGLDRKDPDSTFWDSTFAPINGGPMVNRSKTYLVGRSADPNGH